MSPEKGPNFDELIIGSAFEGAEGMFHQDEENVAEKSEIDIDSIREKRGILPDAEQRFYDTLAEHGYKFVQNETLPYPTLDEWVKFRIENNRGTKYYPCFVEDNDGTILFGKFQLRENSPDNNSLQYEAGILSSDTPAIEHVLYADYNAPSETQLSYLVTEAIPFTEGRVARANEWTATHAARAAEEIRKFEDFDLEQLPEHLKDTPQFQRDIDAVAGTRNMLERSAPYLDPDLAEKLSSILTSTDSIRQVFIHGDATPKNIVLTKDGDTKFIDWETCGKGFLGQDAGKVFAGLKQNIDARNGFLSQYLSDGEDLDNERLQALMIGLISNEMAHITYRVDNVMSKPDLERYFSKTKEEINKFASTISSTLQGFEEFQQRA